MERMYPLVTELKRSRAPQILQTLRGSCIEQLKELFADIAKDEHPAALAELVQLLLDHCPDTPHFELVVCNLVEDICCAQAIGRLGRQAALEVSQKHSSPLSDSISFSLTNPLFDMLPKSSS